MQPLSKEGLERLLYEGWIVNLDQVASVLASTVTDGAATGCRALDLRVAGGLDLRVLPDRGLDILAASFAGTPLAWISPVGETAPLPSPQGTQWLDRFSGGLLTTCGLRNVGAPSEGHGLHGAYSHLRARSVATRRSAAADGVTVAVTGAVDEVSALGSHLRVERQVTTRCGEARAEVVDVTRNLGDAPEPAPLLYHVNVGAPLWGPGSRLRLDSREVRPRDDGARAAVDDWDVAPAPVARAAAQVFEHVVAVAGDGWRSATVTSPLSGLVLTLRWHGLPRFHQWRHPGRAVLGLEPANCSVLGRGADRAAGTLPVLQPGEARTTRLMFEVREEGR